MRAIHRTISSGPLGLCLLSAVLIVLSVWSRAEAGMLGGESTDSSSLVLYNDPTLVEGTAAKVIAIKVPSPGDLQLTLTDEGFTSSFASIQFGVTEPDAVLSALTGPGTLTVDLTKPTTLYAEVFAVTQGSMGVGLYDLKATLLTTSPVPLPQTSWLLALPLVLLLRYLASSARLASDRDAGESAA